MPRVLTDGKIKIGAYMFPDRKKPALCIEEGNTIQVYGYFQTEEGAEEFINRMGNMVRAEIADKVPVPNITPNTRRALETIGKQTHGEIDFDYGAED